MREFTLLLVFVTPLIFGCSGSNNHESKEPIDHSELTSNQAAVTSNQDDSPIEFPEIDFSSLSTLNPNELRIVRNSIFAKYGRTFKSDDLKKYFENQPWYKESDRFSRDLLSESDKSIIELITHLEKNENILWKSISNIDGEGGDELCIVVDKSDHSGATIYINEKKIELRNNWFEEEPWFNDKSFSPEWGWLEFKIIDINKLDSCQELVASQKYLEYEDPGFENVIITKHNGLVKSYTLGSNSYNSGELTLSENKIILNVSNCPAHTQTYSILNGVISMESELIGEYPEGGCAACFVGNSMVAIEGGNRKEISKLRAGDKVISYDTKTGIKSETIIEEIVSVHHSSLVELIFNHDTITSTLDHPFYVKGKGWCSTDPTATNFNYSNYNSVGTIEIGDEFISSGGSNTKLMEVRHIESPQKTYTITRLKHGDAFFVNDVLVGVEEIRNPF